MYRDRRQLDIYLDYLRREGEMFRSYLEGSELASVYFGGGTSNLYKADQYAALMDLVRGASTYRSNARRHSTNIQPRETHRHEGLWHQPRQHGRTTA